MLRDEAAEKLICFVRAWRRARAKLGRATVGVNLDERLIQYWQIWRQDPDRLLSRFAAPHNKDLVEYLMRLIEFADRGDISATDPAFFRWIDYLEAKDE